MSRRVKLAAAVGVVLALTSCGQTDPDYRPAAATGTCSAVAR